MTATACLLSPETLSGPGRVLEKAVLSPTGAGLNLCSQNIPGLTFPAGHVHSSLCVQPHTESTNRRRDIFSSERTFPPRSVPSLILMGKRKALPKRNV